MLRLVRFGAPGQEIPGILDDHDRLRDARPWVADWRGAALAPDFLGVLATRDCSALPLVRDTPRFGACVGGVGKIIGIALNYHEHVVETGSRPTTEPTLFLKATSALCGAHDPIIMPKEGTKLDWEVELGVVMGKTALNVPEAAALDYVAGYCLLDDVSERAFQIERGGQQHTKGKSAASFCPLGPWLVPAAALPDPQQVQLWTAIDGEHVQDGCTAQMIYSVAALVAYCSRFMILEPGDVIATGTPAGVGRGMNPPRYLQLGETVTMGGTGLGEQRHIVRAA